MDTINESIDGPINAFRQPSGSLEIRPWRLFFVGRSRGLHGFSWKIDFLMDNPWIIHGSDLTPNGTIIDQINF